MRICLPTVNDAGLSARLSPHFGRAPYFTVVDSENGGVEVLSNTHARHEHGHCNPTAALADTVIDAVVCRGLGGHALALLEAQGLPVYLTNDWSVEGAVEGLQAGRLERMGADDTCRHHEG